MFANNKTSRIFVMQSIINHTIKKYKKMNDSEVKYHIDIEKSVDKFLDEHAFISKIYTMYRILVFAMNKGLSFDKSHITWVKSNKARNIMAVRPYTQRVQKYVEDNTIYKPHLTINNIACQVIENYKAEFLDYLRS